MMSKQGWAGAAVASLMLVSGCGGGFFIDTNNTGSSTGNSTIDYVYTVNSTNNTINEYSLTGATLALVSGSPVTLSNNLGALSVAVSRANTYVYVGGSQVISSYNIGSTGGLTLNTAAAATETNANFISLDTSPDGKWLVAMDSAFQTLYVFSINTSNGGLTLMNSLNYTANANSGSVVPKSVSFAPSGLYVAAALGTNGTQLFTFNDSTAALTYSAGVPLNLATTNDNAVAFDPNTANLYIARGGATAGASQLLSYGISSAGLLTGTGNAVVSGNAPFSLVVEAGGGFLYVANRGDNTVSGYSIASGVLTPLSGSPYAVGSGGAPVGLVEDKSKTYIVAAGANGGAGKDLTLYTFGVTSPGVLSPVATAASGLNGITAIAATH